MKKGISPLIAMVLAIAFIAAILAMVMSWILTHRPNIRMCEELSTSLSYACEEGRNVNFEIRNGANIPIEAISIASDGNEMIEDGIPANSFGDYSVPKPTTGELLITPVLGDDQEIVCAEKILQVPIGALEMC